MLVYGNPVSWLILVVYFLNHLSLSQTAIPLLHASHQEAHSWLPPSDVQHPLSAEDPKEIHNVAYLAQFHAGSWDATKDKAQMDIVNRAYNDALVMAYLSYKALKDKKNPPPLFVTYFGTTDGDFVEFAQSVFRNVWTGAKEQEKTRNLLSNLYFRKKKTTGDYCDEKRPDGNCVVAYCERLKAKVESDVVLCNEAWKYEELTQGRLNMCADIGDRVDARKMDSIGRLVLHEIIHHWEIGQKADPQEMASTIDDLKEDKIPMFEGGVYGPFKVRQWLKDGPKDDLMLTLYNADTYAWFAQELYWSRTCGKDGKLKAYQPPVEAGNTYRDPTCKL